MGKFIITEEEKQHIKSLYERIGDKLTPEMSNSLKAQYTKKTASFLNSYYKINLGPATTGSWTDKDYNDYLKKFMEEKGISVWVCKKGDGYCSDDGSDEGEITTKELDKLKQAMSPSNPNEKINTTHDKNYDYKLSNGKYYFKGKGSLSTKYPNWVEAKGKGLESIKTNVKFT